jgi:hypothetical protein
MAVIITGNNTPTAGGVTYGDGSTYANTAAGTSGQLLQSNGAGAPTWATISTNPTVVLSARTSNTILGAADQSTLIDITSGTFSQTFTAAATLGSGWFCYIRNSGTGDITLDPNGGETIDGLTSYIMYPGEARLVQCDGAAFTSLVLSAFSLTFTASGTFTKPPGYTQFMVEAFGAGGGGGSGRKMGSGTPQSGGAGGGGGSYITKQLLASALSASETVTVGAGGTGAAGGNAPTTDGVTGGIGGTTTFGSLVTANPGFGGDGGQLSSSSTGGPGGGVIATANSTSTKAEISNGGAGGQTNYADANGYVGYGSFVSGAAGGGGGGRPTDRNGGAGGSRINQGGGGSGGAFGTGSTPGTNGGDGVSFGFGGGGGGSAYQASAGSGGAGGVNGGGGGGGCCYGYYITGAYSGSGGNGGRGEIRIQGIA